MLQRLRQLTRNEKGATAIEYGLIVTCVALAVVGSMSFVADETIGMWNYLDNELGSRL